MSTALVEKEIERFLATREPEVLCLRGKWGVGKTHAWDAILRRARDKNGIALDSYAYVSLFGRDTLEQLKYAIFENGIALSDIGTDPTVETFKSNTAALFKRLGKQTFSFLQNLPQAADHATELQSLAFLSVRERLVCIDDLERMGQHLPMKDVLGLISDLRDQKHCKVVLILNDDALEGTDRTDFELYNEKVIDRSLVFEPEAVDSVRIAVTGDHPSQVALREALIALDIANIRIIKKIEQLVAHVAPMLQTFDLVVLRGAVRSLTLLGWSANSREAPTIDFLRTQRSKHVFGHGNGEATSDAVREWNALLDAYGFTTLDEFDLELLKGIQRGFFDERALVAWAGKRAEKNKAAQMTGSFDQAWRLYTDSFLDNEAEIAKEISNAVRKTAQFVSPLNLNAAVKLLKDLNRPVEAADMLRNYMGQRKDDRGFFDLSIYPFAADITDPEVKAAFDERYRSFQDNRTPADALINIAKTKTCTAGDISQLSKLSADDFRTLFKAQNGPDRTRVIHTAIRLNTISGAGDQADAIATAAKEALKAIAQESPLNKRRVLHLLDRKSFEN